MAKASRLGFSQTTIPLIWPSPQSGQPDKPKLDYLMIGFDTFAGRDSFRQHRIGEGSTVMVTGYFVQFPGERRFQPILRQGVLSMIPDEPMKTTTGKLGTVY